MIRKVKTLTIRRSQWLHGEGWEVSRLLRESDGKMCCLGILSKASGATRADLLEKIMLHDVPSVWDLYSNTNLNEDSVIGEMYKINDAENILPEDREKQLKEKFKLLDIKVRFID